METLSLLFFTAVGGFLLFLSLVSALFGLLGGLISYTYMVDHHIIIREKIIYVAVTSAFTIWSFWLMWMAYRFSLHFLV